MRVASSLENIKLSLKIDHNYDDPILNVLIDTAEDYVINASDSSDTSVIKEFKQFDWSVSLLAQHWYLNQQEASGERIPTGVQAMIQQMKGKYYANH